MADTGSWLPKPLVRSLLWLAAALVVGYLVVPQLPGLRRSWQLVRDVELVFVVAGVALQAAAIVAQAQLTRSMLPAETRPTLPAMVRIELSSTAVSHTVPGGTAAGTAVAYRLLHRAGTGKAEAAFAVGARGLGSALVLNVLLWLALVISIPAQGFRPLYGTAAALGAALVGGFGLLVVLLVRDHEGAERFLRRLLARVPLLEEDAAARALSDVADRMRETIRRPLLLVRVVVWSAAYWLASAAALWVFLAGFGHHVHPASLVVAFGLANVLAFVPVTPQGLGVVEATLIPLLVWFGAGRTEAAVGVLAWRLVQFWLPIPLGAAAYVTLRIAPAQVEGEPVDRRGWLRELADDALDKAEDLGAWARRHGFRPRRSP